jgi:hypothetical protein
MAVRSIPIPTPSHTTSLPVPANETPHAISGSAKKTTLLHLAAL